MCALFLLSFLNVGNSRAEAAAAISQAFHTSDTNVVIGALMSLREDTPSNVELSNTERRNQLMGVVGNNPLIELSEVNKSVQVVTSGVTGALVSDINGDIATGDKVTASPIDGIGMKAIQSSLVVGTAQADLTSVKLTERTIKDVDGKEHTIRVGLIPVQVNVTFYAAPNDGASYLPGFLQDFANTIAGKDVSPVRVLIAAAMLLLAFVSIVALLYASVRSSIISIGRNPLSEAPVRKGMIQIGITAVGILLLTLITIYLILST